MSADLAGVSGPRVNAGAAVEQVEKNKPQPANKAELLVAYTKARKEQETVNDLGKKAATLRQDIYGLKTRLKAPQQGPLRMMPNGSAADLRAKESELRATEQALMHELCGSLHNPAANALRTTNAVLEALKENIAGLKADLTGVGREMLTLQASGQADTPRYAALELRQDLLQGQLDSARQMEAPLASLRLAAMDAISLQGQMLIAQQTVNALPASPSAQQSLRAEALQKLQGLQERAAAATSKLDRQTMAVTQARATQASQMNALHQQLMPRCDALIADHQGRIEQATGAALEQAQDLSSELQDLHDSISSLDASGPDQGGADEGVAGSEGAGASAQDD